MSSSALIWRCAVVRRAHIAIMAVVIGTQIASSASGAISVLHNFAGGLGGETPTGIPLADSGFLYGVTSAGGSGSLAEGVLWRRDSGTGAYTVAHSFEDAVDGSGSVGNLVLVGRELFGTNSSGGMFQAGTLWSYQLDTQTFAVKKHFDGTSDGAFPRGLAVVGGELVGLCEQGGSAGSGSLWKYNLTAQAFTPLHDFDNSVDGSFPSAQFDVRSSTVYGTALAGGAIMGGTLWSYGLNNQSFATLHDFGSASDGASPAGGLAIAGEVVLGATQNEGANQAGTIWAYHTTSQTLTVRHDFASGQSPRGPVALFGPFLYGVADGGAHEAGVLWQFNYVTNQYAVLADFKLETSGSSPTGVELIDGQLYGVASVGGANSAGTLWKFPLAQRLGDFNGDGAVDAADYTTWRDRRSTTAILNGDPTPGNVTLDDLATWSGAFDSVQPALANTVPELSALKSSLLALATLAFAGSGKQKSAPRWG